MTLTLKNLEVMLDLAHGMCFKRYDGANHRYKPFIMYIETDVSFGSVTY